MVLFGLTVITVLGAGVTTLISGHRLPDPAYARLTAHQTLTLKNSDFILAIESLGASGAPHHPAVISCPMLSDPW